VPPHCLPLDNNLASGSDLLLFAEVFELNILKTRMKRRNRKCDYNIEMNLQIFESIDRTELADDGVKFGGHECSYEFSTSI
jgi:hypothetical protein